MARKTTVTVSLYYKADMAYGNETFKECISSILKSDYKNFEIIIVDSRGEGTPLDFLSEVMNRKVKVIQGSFKNRAAMFNAVVEKARGTLILNITNDQVPVFLKQSAITAMAMSMERDPKAGMVYADYELIDENAIKSERHLLPYHQGRCRDPVDFGQAIMYRIRYVKKVGGACEDYNVGDLYDLRFKISEKYNIRHIANKIQGSLYTVRTEKKAHDVFDYLLASKESQLEMERVFTEHLKRSGAYLPPGFNYHKVEYSPEEEGKFKDCIASVVIPVNRRPEFIATAIESVQNQTVKNIEAIVVVNGGPEDPTADTVRRYMPGGDRYSNSAPPVRLIVLDINNIGLCLDVGISEARGKYYVQLDSDDRLKPDAVEKILAEFDKDPRAGMVIGSYEVWEKEEETGRLFRREEIPVVTHDEWTEENGRNNLLRVNGAGAPRSWHVKVIKEMGWFGMNDTAYSRNYGEDYELVLRTSEKYRIARVWEPIYEVIRHKGGTDHSIDQATIDRNDDAKDFMRLETIKRRIALNKLVRRRQ